MKQLKWCFFVISVLVSSLSFAEEKKLIFKEVSLTAKMVWEKGPGVSPAESVLQLEFMNSELMPFELENLPQVSIWMPDMGHGSGPTSVQRVLDENGNIRVGVYKIRNIYFIMSGFWELRVAVQSQSGTSKVVVPVEIY